MVLWRRLCIIVKKLKSTAGVLYFICILVKFSEISTSPLFSMNKWNSECCILLRMYFILLAEQKSMYPSGCKMHTHTFGIWCCNIDPLHTHTHIERDRVGWKGGGGVLKHRLARGSKWTRCEEWNAFVYIMWHIPCSVSDSSDTRF